MTSQLRPPSAPRPLPTTRVEIQLPPTPFNSKDFVEMTESITRETSGGPKEHQQRIENQQPQWQPLALENLVSQNPTSCAKISAAENPRNKNHPTQGDLGNSLTSPTHRPCPVELRLRGIADMQFSRAPTESSIPSKRTITAESPMTSYRTANTPPH